MKNFIKIMILSFLIVITGCGSNDQGITLLSIEDTSESHDHSLLEEGIDEEELDDLGDILISVYICGAVNKPGVYEFELGERVTHAIEKAEGFTKDADSEFWNLAQILIDGEKIYIPTKDEVKSGYVLQGSYEAGGMDTSGKININTASKEQLMTLAGVGESKALSIINYRDTNGSFKAIEDVMKISGIKDAVFNTIKDYITV